MERFSLPGAGVIHADITRDRFCTYVYCTYEYTTKMRRGCLSSQIPKRARARWERTSFAFAKLDTLYQISQNVCVCVCVFVARRDVYRDVSRSRMRDGAPRPSTILHPRRMRCNRVSVPRASCITEIQLFRIVRGCGCGCRTLS